MTSTYYTGEERSKRIFAIVGASSGNLVERFDSYVYAFCAIYFAPAFFPSDDPTVQLLNTAGVLAAGFLMRPIGGWIFGRLADRHGRKNSLMISVLIQPGVVYRQFLHLDQRPGEGRDVPAAGTRAGCWPGLCGGQRNVWRFGRIRGTGPENPGDGKYLLLVRDGDDGDRLPVQPAPAQAGGVPAP